MAKATRPAKKKGSGSSTEPLLRAEDFRRYLRENADVIAPGDVEPLVRRREAVLVKVARNCSGRERLERQLTLALNILEDHVTHRSPQIPSHTISLLTVALLYFMNPMDVIPDWIRGVGTSDDALLVELAFEAAAPGVERYCTWKGISTDNVLGPIPATVSRKKPK